MAVRSYRMTVIGRLIEWGGPRLVACRVTQISVLRNEFREVLSQSYFSCNIAYRPQKGSRVIA